MRNFLELLRAVGALLEDDATVPCPWRLAVLEEGQWAPEWPNNWLGVCDDVLELNHAAVRLVDDWHRLIAPARRDWIDGRPGAAAAYRRMLRRLLHHTAAHYGVTVQWELDTLDPSVGTHDLRTFVVAMFISRQLQLRHDRTIANGVARRHAETAAARR